MKADVLPRLYVCSMAVAQNTAADLRAGGRDVEKRFLFFLDHSLPDLRDSEQKGSKFNDFDNFGFRGVPPQSQTPCMA